jgi:hypothetical protein
MVKIRPCNYNHPLTLFRTWRLILHALACHGNGKDEQNRNPTDKQDFRNLERHGPTDANGDIADHWLLLWFVRQPDQPRALKISVSNHL